MSKLPWLLIGVVVVAIGAAALRVPIGIAAGLLGGGWSFVQSVTVDHGTYYRLKVSLAYKGAPQDFDIVVACSVRQINYSYGGRTYEAGLTPSVFGRRMLDGKGLVVRPPNACAGQTTANGRVPHDLLPLVIVYDHADTLDFGIGYISEDAYENPLSVLTFGGATIEAATRRDFDRFRRSQANLVTRDVYWTGKGAAETIRRMGLTPAAKPFGGICEAYKRYAIPQEARALVRESWPDEKQRYWVPETRGDPYRYGHQNDLIRAIVRSRSATGPVPGWEADYGMPTRRGGGVIDGSGLLFPAAYYPAANDFRSDRWPADRSQWPAYVAAHGTLADADIDFRGGATKGFAYCYAMSEGMLDSHWRDIVQHKAIVARVDGQDVVSNRAPWNGASRPMLILDRDEYAYIVLYFGLGSPRGDV